jgi:DNA-binding MarR family transcriptional regulator
MRSIEVRRESSRKAAKGTASVRHARLGEQAVIAVLRVANRITLELTALLKPHGLTPSQYNALRILRGVGESGLTCRELGERMLTRDPDITRLIDRLERAGLATRLRETGDRRVVTTRITRRGIDALAGLDAAVATFDRGLFAGLGDASLRQLVVMLDAVLES